MKTILTLITLLLCSIDIYAQQTKREFKCAKVYEAVKLINEGKYDESIVILKDCEKVDPSDYTYPYEIALALTYKKDYQLAIDQLEKIKNYVGLGADYYQLLGNNYDYAGKPDKAMEVYDYGLSKFPQSGRLYLERGVIYESQDKYLDAIGSYEKGIKVDPGYPSCYYRVAKIYLNSNDKLSGLIYGEIFMNIERKTKRTLEMSRLLFDNYKKAVEFNNNEMKMDFCKLVINADNIKGDKVTLPLCGIFGKNFVLALIGENEINLNSLSEIRIRFIKNYFQEDYKTYPNVLFTYLKLLQDNNLLSAYNHYIFQMGSEKEFENWKAQNNEEYNRFVDWYLLPENSLKVNSSNLFISDSMK